LICIQEVKGSTPLFSTDGLKVATFIETMITHPGNYREAGASRLAVGKVRGSTPLFSTDGLKVAKEGNGKTVRNVQIEILTSGWKFKVGSLKL
jgi:hypothetical protein